MKITKYFITFLILLNFMAYSQTQDNMKEIDSLINLRQPNAAQTKLWEVIDNAQKNNDQNLLIKAYSYFNHVIYQMENDEKADLYFNLFKQSEKLYEPANSLIQLRLLNEMTFNFNSWFGYGYNQIYDSINLGETTNRSQFVLEKIESLETKLESLKKYSFEAYESVLTNKNNIDIFLYNSVSDYVTYQIIEIYKSYLIKDYGELKNTSKTKKEWYSTPDIYKTLNFDTAYLDQRILNLYQQISNNNANNLDFLSVATYLRVLYLQNQFKEKELLKDAWQQQFDFFKLFSARSKFLFEIEKIRYSEGLKYHFKTHPEPENFIHTAYTNLKNELEKFEDNDFEDEIEDLIDLIEEKEFNLQVEKIILPHQKIPVYIKYRNFSEYYISVYKIKNYSPKSSKSILEFAKSNELELVHSKKIELENKGLFQLRSTEFFIDELKDLGSYYVIVTPKDIGLKEIEKFSSTWSRSHEFSYSQIYVTEIAATSSKINQTFNVLVVDQKTGKPIKDAEVQLFTDNFRNKNSKPKAIGKTNKDGVFSAEMNKGSYYYYIVKYKNSILSGSEYGYYSNSYEQATAQVFTDRAIYRPGQTVHFKAITYEGKESEFKAIPNTRVRVTIKDASYQEIYDKVLKTNQFGSIDGEFVLPTTLPLGRFQIITQVIQRGITRNQNKYFSVEEYKRPTFEIQLNMPKDEAKLNDTVTITGNAKAFAGFPIDNAKVTYSVYRKWSKYWFFFRTGGSGDLLTEGELQTDSEGNFSIDFFSETDPNAQRFAYYHYSVKVKVTDLSGETHEDEINLNLSEISASLSIKLPANLLTHEKGGFLPQVVNLSGEPMINETSNGEIKIYKIEEDERFLPRIWENAEYSRFTVDEEKLFADLYPYQKLDSYEDKPQKTLVNTFQFKMNDTISYQTLINKYLKKKQGKYIFEFNYKTTSTKEKYDLKFEHEIALLDVTNKELASPNALWTFVSSNEAEVGQAIDFQIGSSFKKSQALVSFFRGRELVSQEWVDVSKRHSICYTIEEKDRGNLVYEVLLFNNGVFYHSSEKITVPFSNKKLIIKTETFRDQLLPGQKEQWKFTIKDNHDNFINNAELAAAMYDASLDQFAPNDWKLWMYRAPLLQNNWSKYWSNSLSLLGIQRYSWDYSYIFVDDYVKYYEQLGYKKTYFSYSRNLVYGQDSVMSETVEFADEEVALEEVMVRSEDILSAPIRSVEKKSEAEVDTGVQEQIETQPQNVRSSFNETAFFYPTIYANDKNEYVLDFTLPESLTKWKLLMLSHNQEMQIGTLTKTLEAKKDLMITPNAPRFLRQGDEIEFSAKVVNLTDKIQTVEVELKLENPENLAELNLITSEKTKTISVPANSTEEVSWWLKIDEQELIQYTITAANDEFSDGERNIIPVLSNRVLITETSHILLKNKGVKTHTFDRFQNQDSETLENKTYRIEYIDNLAWEAVLALPSLSMENNKSSTTLINKYYANSISKSIVDKYPKIKQIFDQWKMKSPEVFISELEKNQELKNILLSETPWVLDAKNETEKRRRIAALFELNQINNTQTNIINELRKRQNGDGGFSWFDGGESSLYITQNILVRFGQLQRLGIDISSASGIVKAAEKFVAQKQVYYYKKYVSTQREKDRYRLFSTDVYWLYTRIFFNETNSADIEELTTFYQEKLKKDWHKQGIYMQSLIGLYFKKVGFNKEANIIYQSLLDRAKKNTHIGTYWAENSGYFWHENKIATQAMIISFFQEMNTNESIMDDARLWLILNKESNAWETGVESAEAIYAILLSGKNYLESSPQPKISLGGKNIVFESTGNNNDILVDWTPGLGQFKHQWNGSEIHTDLGKVTVEKHSDAPSVLNLYWQYTEEISKIDGSTDGSLSIKKNYYKLIPGAKEETRIEVDEYQVGDKIEIELIVSVDRDLEFVHIKDLRPSGFEPTQVLSGYQWNKGLIYYQSVKDVSMEYFVEWMNKGTYKLTYTVYATHSGKFDSGMATVQSFYAPKFAGHSKSESIKISK